MGATGLFDDLVETDAANAETSSEASTETDAQSLESGTEKAAETPERDSVTVTSLNELPEGYVDVKTFAWKLTERNLSAAQSEGRVPGPDDMVDTQAVYAATRGKRWALPSLEAVTAEGTKLGVIIPLDAGFAAWDERPERGTGSSSSVGMTPERRETRILRAGKAAMHLENWQKRVKRYGELLAEVGATWDDAKEAYEKWTESEEGKKAAKDFGNDNEEQ
jgi:hypothetical protein